MSSSSPGCSFIFAVQTKKWCESNSMQERNFKNLKIWYWCYVDICPISALQWPKITLASNFKKNGRKWILMSHPSAATVTFITFAQLLLYPDMSTGIRRGFNRWIPVLNYTWHDFCNSYVLCFSWTPPFSSSSKSHLYDYHHYLFSYTVWRVW